jgi:hypothetical protein
MRRLREQLAAFLFPAESDRWLSVLRIGLGLQVTLYVLSARADWNELFGSNGQALVNRELTEAVLNVESPLAPRLGWLISLGSRLGLSESAVLWTVWGCLLCAGCLLLAGLFSRPAAIAAWLLHLCAIKSEQFLSYGMDNFTTIGLFYLMLSPLPDRCALDWRIFKPKPRHPQLLGFFRRVLQVHVCIIYFFGGITKCMGAGWWNGDSIWQAMTSPPYNIVSPQVLVHWKYFLPILGISICVIETGYPLFIWLRRTRLIWLILACGMHVGIGYTMGLYLFSLIMIVLNLAAFGPDFSFDLSKAKSFERRIPPGETAH